MIEKGDQMVMTGIGAGAATQSESCVHMETDKVMNRARRLLNQGDLALAPNRPTDECIPDLSAFASRFGFDSLSDVIDVFESSHAADVPSVRNDIFGGDDAGLELSLMSERIGQATMHDICAMMLGEAFFANMFFLWEFPETPATEVPESESGTVNGGFIDTLAGRGIDWVSSMLCMFISMAMRDGLLKIARDEGTNHWTDEGLAHLAAVIIRDMESERKWGGRIDAGDYAAELDRRMTWFYEDEGNTRALDAFYDIRTYMRWRNLARTEDIPLCVSTLKDVMFTFWHGGKLSYAALAGITSHVVDALEAGCPHDYSTVLEWAESINSLSWRVTSPLLEVPGVRYNRNRRRSGLLDRLMDWHEPGDVLDWLDFVDVISICNREISERVAGEIRIRIPSSRLITGIRLLARGCPRDMAAEAVMRGLRIGSGD